MTTNCSIIIPSDACSRSTSFRGISVANDVVSVESLLTKISSRLSKGTRFLLPYKAKRVKAADSTVSLRLYPIIKQSKNTLTLDTFLTDVDNKQAQRFSGLMEIDRIAKMERVYKLCKQILEALKELYGVLALMHKKNADVQCIHGLLIPSSIYWYPNGQIKLTYYGLVKPSNGDSIHYDLSSLSSVYCSLCEKLRIDPEKSFNDTVEKFKTSSRTRQLEAMLKFVESRIYDLSKSSGVTGHFLPPSNLEESLKDGADECALPNNIEVDELEKSSTIGISASSRSLCSSSDPSTSIHPPEEVTTTLVNSISLIPEKCIEQIHQHYTYPAEQNKPEGLCSVDEGYTMTILLTASQDIQMVCPYLTYFSILSSKHPIQEMRKNISEGNILHVFTMENVFEMLRDLSQSVPIIDDALSNQETILQMLEIAFTGSSQSKEYIEMNDTKRSLLYSNMPRLVKFLMQDSNLHSHVMVTDPNLESKKVMEKELWTVFGKGIKCYLNLINGKGWHYKGENIDSDDTKDRGVPSKQQSEVIASCIMCLKSYLHVAIISYPESFTNQIDKNEAYMSIALECIKLSIFEITFLMYFSDKRCSHALANNMVVALVKKDGTHSPTCSFVECSSISRLLVTYLTSRGTVYLNNTFMNELLFVVIDCLEISITNESSEEYQKVPLIARILINYYILYLSQCALELIRETKGIEENIRNCFACLNIFITKLYKTLTASNHDTSGQTCRDSSRYHLLVYITMDCLAKLFHCVGGIEHLIVKCRDSIYTGDEYSQICRPVHSREESMFISYSELPSTAIQGIGGPAIWQTENYRQNRKKISIIYRGILALISPHFAEFLASISRCPALFNSSIIQARITMILNVIVDALYVVMQNDSKTVAQQYMKYTAALGLKHRLEIALNCKSTQSSTYRDDGASSITVSNRTNTVYEDYTYSTIRKIIDLFLGITETQIFYIRHLMSDNNISRDDFVFDVKATHHWCKDAYLKAIESLKTNKAFISFLKAFGISYNMVSNAMKVDTFYRDTVIGSFIDDDSALLDLNNTPA